MIRSCDQILLFSRPDYLYSIPHGCHTLAVISPNLPLGPSDLLWSRAVRLIFIFDFSKPTSCHNTPLCQSPSSNTHITVKGLPQQQAGQGGSAGETKWNQPNKVPTPSSSSSSSTPPVFPALHLTPLNNTFVPKQISLDPPGQKVKIGRQTNAKTVPNGTNGYFDSKVLSRAHAEVWSEDNKVFIKDVKSSSGTFINGERLSPESAESDIFELYTDDEFGIDILTDDTKTIVHHKVHLVMNADDALASSREFNNWHRQAGEQNLQHQQSGQPQQPGLGMGQEGQGGQGGQGGGGMMTGQGGVGGGPARRPARAPMNARNGLSFEYVLSRLQSRDTGSNLNDVKSTLCDVHDTLGGSVPRPSSTAQTNGGPLPYPTTSSLPPRPQAQASNESIQALQQQLNDLASHVGRI
ncbi:hypothetical protein JCM5353_000542 [Sporobolomyces roseus]